MGTEEIMRASLYASTLVALAAGVATAQAGGFAVREQSAYGQGSSFAGMAAPGDSISSMFWNPAAVTTVNGITVEGDVTGVIPNSELDLDPSSTLAAFGNGGNIGENGIAPAGYFAMPVTDQLYFGVSVNAPYGFSTTSNVPWAGMLNHLDAEVTSINVAPVLGFKFNDMVSAAVGIQVQYFDVDIETALAPVANPPRQELEGDSTDVGFVAGLTLTPMDGTTIGLGYRSGIDHSISGTQTFDITPVAFPISADLDLNDTVSAGVRQRINDAFTVMAGVEWTNWSSLQTIPIEGSPVPGASLVLNYDDGWFFSAGAEYKFNPNWTFRGGLGYEIAPTTDEFRSLRLPDADRVWASVGASYNWNEQLSIDFGYSHLFVDDAPVSETATALTPLGPVPVTTSGTFDSHVDIFAIGVRYKFGGPAVAMK
jgi:long-chain fatty acid transport protein